MFDYFSLYSLQNFSDNFLFLTIFFLVIFFFGLLLNKEKFPKIKDKLFLIGWFIVAIALVFYIKFDLKDSIKIIVQI